MTRAKQTLARVWNALQAPYDVAALAAFRILFGVLMSAAVVRYVQMGWIQEFYLEPTFHFAYWGFDWVRMPPAWGVQLLFGTLFALGLCVAAGLFYRFSIVAFLLVFTYLELADVTNYLNHYYQVSLLALLMAFLPMHRAWSLDSLRHADLRVSHLPAWMTWLLRFQVGVVYFYAALAKAGPDWLLHGQPLGLWLASRTETPVIGPWLDLPWVPLAMSWAGFLHDLLVVPGLLWRRTRPFAYAVLVSFHLVTGYFFDIGVFPFLMILSALVFFSPSWPRKVLRSAAPAVPGKPTTSALGWRHVLGLGTVGAYALVQLLVPLRAHLYEGNVLWHEQGMRWSWRVMVREKQGSVTYHVRLPNDRTVQVSPNDYLTCRQEREMSGQPDMVLQLAHHIADDFERRGLGKVEVHAEALVSLNGRRPKRMIDPTVDLTKVDDGLGRASWIVPGPSEAPPHLRRPELAGNLP